MRNKQAYFIILTVFLVFSSCYDTPEFSPIPKISFKKIRFVDVDGFADSLILTFNFQDGDGDIGLRSREDGFPYHSFSHVIDAEGRFVTLKSDSLLPPFRKIVLNENLNELFIIEDDKLYLPNPDPATTQQFSDTDDRPVTYNCEDYVLDSLLFISETDSFFTFADTFYIARNEFHKNIYVDFYRKLNGNYQLITDNEFSPNSACPEGFDSRFPVFNPRNIRDQNAISGTITYPMLSQGFKSIFRNDTIQIRFFIYDRALNKSETVRSRDFTLFDF